MRKKRYQGLGILLIVVVVLFLVNIFLTQGRWANVRSSISRSSGASVLELSVNGIISAETQKELLGHLQDISGSPEGLRGLILKINSPGGTTGTSQEIYNELMKIRKLGIKIVSVIGDLGASGGYYIASASDWILANGSSLTGSIGVIMSTFNFKGIADKYGIKSINFVSGKMKDMLSPFRDIRPDEKDYINGMIQTIYNQFVGDVLLGRNGSVQKISKEKLLSIADGRVLTGIDAQKEGLIDELGGYSSAIEAMKKLLGVQDIDITTFSKNYMQQFLQVLRGEFHGVIGSSSSIELLEESFLKNHPNTPLYYSSLGSLL